jgi:uncharacterized protein YhdP
MKRIILHISHTLIASALAILVLMAVLFSFARVISPLLSTQRESVEYWVSEALDRPVKIGSLEIIWNGLHPVIRSTKVIIFNKRNTHELLETDELDIGVDLLKSFLTGRARLGHIRIVGSHLTLKQRPNDSFVLAGIGTVSSGHLFATSSDALNELITWLFSEPQFTLVDITLKWLDKDGRQLPLHKINLILKNTRNHHVLWGKAELAQTPSSRLSLIFDVKGNWNDKENLKARFYFKGKDVVLSQWIKRQSTAPENLASEPMISETETPLEILSATAFTSSPMLPLVSGRGDFQLWGDWEHRHLQNIQTEFSLYDFKLTTKQPFAITQLSANVFAERNKDSNWGFTSDLNSENSEIDFDTLFPEPIPLDQFSAHVEGSYNTEAVSIQASHVHLKNRDGELRGHLGLLIPRKTQESPTISLLAHVHYFGAKHIGNYLPRQVLKPNLIKWLTDSIKALQEADSKVIINGKLSDFPFEKGPGLFLIDTYITKAELDYLPGWPTVSQLSGRLIFKGRSMEFYLDSGKFFSLPLDFSIPLKKIHAVIPWLEKDKQAVLSIDGNVNSTLTDGFNFLRATPIEGKMLNVIKNFDGTGLIKTQIHLTIPLEKGEVPLKVAGAINLANNTLNIREQNINLENLSGLINFTEDSVNSTGLSATIWNKSVTLDVSTRYAKTDIAIRSGDLFATIKPQASGWRVNVKSPGIIGDILVPQNKSQALKACFQKLYIANTDLDNSTQWLPSEVPNTCLTIHDFRYEGKCFGQIQIRLIRVGDNVKIILVHRGIPYSLLAHGLWYTQNDHEWTQLAGTLKSRYLELLLKNWKLPEAMQAKKTQINFNVIWPGAAYNPGFKNMNGNFNLQFREGKILKLGASSEAKLNLGKLLNFLSIESLAHHLTLNFSDMNNKGFSFDTIDGNFLLQNGNAFTHDLKIKGQIANIDISGRVGFSQKDYDLTVNVKPDVTASLPVIMAVVGGPVAGVITWVANKILTPVFREITSSSYHMTGSWSKPDITKISMKKGKVY